MPFDNHLKSAWWALRIGLGLAAFLAGLDKFFNLLTVWTTYLNPLATQIIPVSPTTFMHAVGVIEMIVGVAILTRWTRLGAYVAMAWLACIAMSLVAMGAFFDVAVRDLEMAIAAFALARLTEVRTAAGEIRPAGSAGLGRMIAMLLVGTFAASAHAVLAAPSDPQRQAMKPAAATSPVTPAAAALREGMRKLWSDHVIWTRDYIVAAVGGAPDQQSAATRLLKNQDDIGAAVATYYGKAAGDRLTALLKQHIMIAVDVINAAKAHDTAKYQDADAKWQKNGDEIATFLSSANPNWPKATLAEMMKMHLSTTTAEVVARLNAKWDDDVAAFDAVYAHILKMSDALADGIIKQFPPKFEEPGSIAAAASRAAGRPSPASPPGAVRLGRASDPPRRGRRTVRQTTRRRTRPL